MLGKHNCRIQSWFKRKHNVPIVVNVSKLKKNFGKIDCAKVRNCMKFHVKEQLIGDEVNLHSQETTDLSLELDGTVDDGNVFCG